jgi:hypothetical protein
LRPNIGAAAHAQQGGLPEGRPSVVMTAAEEQAVTPFEARLLDRVLRMGGGRPLSLEGCKHNGHSLCWAGEDSYCAVAGGMA